MQNGGVIDPYVLVTKMETQRKLDPMVKRMNGGGRSLMKNPGEYTLQVAEYTGRTAVAVTTEKGFFFSDDRKSLEQSPLVTAAKDAEELADALAKCRSLNGVKPYVWHTRTSSVVTLGSFRSADDPQAIELRRRIPEISTELISRRFSQLPIRPSQTLMMVPKDN